MWEWLTRRFRSTPNSGEKTVKVYLNPLVMLIAGAERQKGRPLTKAEVLRIRDSAASTQMPVAQARKFYASLDEQMPIPRLNPDKIWEEWQAARDRIG
jgi:hypothetical protein